MATSNPSSRRGTRPLPSNRAGAARGRTRAQTGLSFWEKVKLVSGLLTLSLILALTVGIVYAGYVLRQTNDQLASIDSMFDYHPGGVTQIFATDKDPKTGKLYVLGEVFTRYKEYAPSKDIPDLVKDATIAIEDERFYDHVGVDLWAIGRAFYRNITEKHMNEGASTITQQLARRVVLKSQAKTYTRKLKEAMIAVQLERNFSKEQILERYLNEVYYGSRAYGIKSAAKVYFNKPLNKLTLAEAALLVGLPKNPEGYQAFKHLDRAIARRDVVLRKMAELGRAKQADVDKALKEKPHLASQPDPRNTRFRAPYFCRYVLGQLEGKYAVAGDPDSDGVKDQGLKIYTTLNWQMQQEAERAIREGVKENRHKGVTEAAMVSIEPKTGYVRAMVGGVDFQKHQYNNAAQGAGRQPGSTFKAIDYSAAFMTGQYGPDSYVSNERVKYPGGYSPRNFDGRYGGSVSISEAVERSMNIPAVRVTNAIGVGKVVDLAVKLGIPRNHFPPQLNLAIALGAGTTTPLQMASVYSVFPNQGNQARPMAIIRVVDSEGETIMLNQPTTNRQVIPESVAANMSEIFRKTVTQGTAKAASGIADIPEAHAKTGTTSERRDIWFAGYTPELSTVVWACSVHYVKRGKTIYSVYNPLVEDTFGGSTCGPMWVQFMKAAIPIQRHYPQAGRVSPEQAIVKKPTDGDQNGDEDNRPRRRRRRRVEPDEAPAAPATPEIPRATPAPEAPVAEEPKTSGDEKPAPAETTGESGGESSGGEKGSEKKGNESGADPKPAGGEGNGGGAGTTP